MTTTSAPVKERPILFTGAMVRAILAGTKTQTRRLVKPKDAHRLDICDGELIHVHAPDCPGFCDFACAEDRSPYGAPGDRLWGRESIKLVCKAGEWADSVYVADGRPTKADAWPWKRPVLPSIHCPRGLSRLLLDITDVRVQRLQEISRGDCADEGWPVDAERREIARMYRDLGDDEATDDEAIEWYAGLWESINGSGSWDRNPWVWAVSFKRVAP